MKKTFSLVLVLVMVLTLLPLNMTIAEAGNISGHPGYVVEDFENGTSGDAGLRGSSGNGYVLSYTDGVGVSQKALSVKVNADYKSPTFNVALRPGTVYDISFWLRIDETETTASDKTVSLVAHHRVEGEAATTMPSDYNFVPISRADGGKGVELGTWMYYQCAWTVPAKTSGKKVNIEAFDPRAHLILRVCSGKPSGVTDGAINYTIDDFTVMPRESYKVLTSEETSSKFANLYCFEDKIKSDDNYILPRRFSINSGSFKVNATADITPPSITYDGVSETLGGTSGKGAYITITGNPTANYSQLAYASSSDTTHDINFRFGHKYKIYFWAKADNDAAVGKEITPIFEWGSSHNDTLGNIGSLWVRGTPGKSVDLNGTESSGDNILSSEWKKFCFSVRGRQITDLTQEVMNILFRVSDASATWSIGNIRLETDSEPDDVLQTMATFSILKTGASAYHAEYTSTVTACGISSTVTRIMVPHGNAYVIAKTLKDWKNEGALELDYTGNGRFKMVVNPIDPFGNSGAPYEIYKTIREYDTTTQIYAEIDQPIWLYDMNELTATVDYKAMDGSDKLLALCGVYDKNGKMVAGNYDTFDLNQGEGKVTFSIPIKDVTASYAKVFLWKNADLAPVLADVLTFYKDTTGQTGIYVDPVNGKDTNYGQFTRPVATLEKAMEMRDLFGANYIVLMPGRYTRTTQFMIDNTMTDATRPLNIISYSKNNKAVISGGRDLTGQFTAWTNNVTDVTGIYRAKVEPKLISRELYVGGRKATKARSEGYLTNVTNTNTYGPYAAWINPLTEDAGGYRADRFTPTTTLDENGLNTLGHLESTDTSLVNLKRPDDLEFVFFSKWTMKRVQAKSITAGTSTADGTTPVSVITMADSGDERFPSYIYDPWLHGSASGIHKIEKPAYMENAIELLDKEGEWYLDITEGYVYYKPRTSIGENIKTVEVILPVYDVFDTDFYSNATCSNPFVFVKGTAENPVENVTFDSVEFAHVTSTRTTKQNGHIDSQNNFGYNGSGRGEAAIEVLFGHNIDFKNCVFTKIGAAGLVLDRGAQNCEIIGNEFYDISATAAHIGTLYVYNSLYGYRTPTPRHSNGTYYHVRHQTQAEKVSDITFSNNYVHTVAQDYRAAAALSVGYPSNSIISHNEFFDFPYSGIHAGWGWTTDYYPNDNNTKPAGYVEAPTDLTIDITDNYFHHFFQGDIYDGGAIYTLGLSGGTEGDYNKISGNFVENIGTGANAYYNDSGSTYYEVFNNVADISNSWSETSVCTGAKAGPANWSHINVVSRVRDYHLNWHDNYTSGPNQAQGNMFDQDPTSVRENTTIGNNWSPEALAIINNAGIEDAYKKNFRNKLQYVETLSAITMSVGEQRENIPVVASGKDKLYKDTDIIYADVTSSNPSVATATSTKITAKAAGTTTITYSAWENGIERKAEILVTVK